eukprot:g33215.t1
MHTYVWSDTALLITYDEHGGFYDHVAPPMTGVPPPDAVRAPNGFKFDRLGIRVPTLLISQWVKPGHVEHAPPGPQPSSQYDHTSILASANALFGLDVAISARVAWAGSFTHLFNPDQQPNPPSNLIFPALPATPPDDALEWHRSQPINDHTEAQVKFYCTMNSNARDRDRDPAMCGQGLRNIGEAADWLSKEIPDFLAKLRARHGIVQAADLPVQQE